MKRLPVADGILRAKPAGVPKYLLRWIGELEEWQAAFFRHEPTAPGAYDLTRAGQRLRECRQALAEGDAERAAWAGMRAVDHLWRAQMLDAVPMMDAGVTTYRAAESANAAAAARAKTRYAAWQARAEEIWRTNPRLTKRDMGSRLASEFPANPDTIRKAIRKP